MSIKINKDNYDQYKKVLAIIWLHKMKLLDAKLQAELAEVSPMVMLDKWEQKLPKSKLYSGLSQSLADCVSMMDEYPKLAAQIDSELTANNLPNYHTLKGSVLNTITKVIKRKSIKNIDEYYIIKELVDDTASDLSSDQRILLSELLGDFDNKQ